MRRFLIVAILVLAIGAGSASADGLKNFLQQFVQHANNLDKNYSQVGKNLGANLKEGGLKGMLQGIAGDLVSADQANEADRAATIAAFKEAIHDIIFFIPNTIKVIWKGFVDTIKKIFQAGAGAPSAPVNSFAPKASNTEAKASNTEAVDALQSFMDDPDLAARLGTYVEYRRALNDLEGNVESYVRKSDRTIASEEKVSTTDVKKGKKELQGKVASCTEISERMENVLARDIVTAEGGMKIYEDFRRSIDRRDRYGILPSLNMKVLQAK